MSKIKLYSLSPNELDCLSPATKESWDQLSEHEQANILAEIRSVLCNNPWQGLWLDVPSMNDALESENANLLEILRQT